MITGAIALVILIATICSAENGEWGSVAVGAVLILVLLLIGMVTRDDARAYNNVVRYWSRDRR